jgi:hypothetical protein
MFAILSNLALLITAGVAWHVNKLLGFFIFLAECPVSLTYHLCKYYDYCIFRIDILRFFDFFFAEAIIPYLTFSLIEFSIEYEWLHWLMLLTAGLFIALLQHWFEGTLLIQAIIVVTCVSILAIYWIVWGIPRYKWYYLTPGITLLCLSITFFVFQAVYTPYYDVIHGMWHITAALGASFVLMSRKKAHPLQNAAFKIK